MKTQKFDAATHAAFYPGPGEPDGKEGNSPESQSVADPERVSRDRTNARGISSDGELRYQRSNDINTVTSYAPAISILCLVVSW